MLVGGLIWAEEDYRGGSAASFELVGARVGRLRCSGGSGLGSGEGVRGMRCGGALGAEARERWGSGALQRAGHGDGEVAAAELGRDGVARGGEVCELCEDEAELEVGSPWAEVG